MERVLIKPSVGMAVYDPATKKPISSSGVQVVMNEYWRRRLKDRSVVVVVEEVKLKKNDKPETKEVPK